MGEWKGFRTLRADEIDCRVGTASDKGCSLLLYKDARVDMNLLDEAFGPFGWTREHEVIDGDLYCTISVRDPETGIWTRKQDVGTESTTEKEKGRASDSFKRAAVNVGIGRELYTAPFIWVPADKCTIKPGKNGKMTCYDTFRVTRIEYDEARRICALEIVNDSRRGEIVFARNTARKADKTAEPVKVPARADKVPARAAQAPKTGTPAAEPAAPAPAPDLPPSVTDNIGPDEWAEIKSACRAVGMSADELLARYQVQRPSEITLGLRDDMIAFLATL